MQGWCHCTSEVITGQEVEQRRVHASDNCRRLLRSSSQSDEQETNRQPQPGLLVALTVFLIQVQLLFRKKWITANPKNTSAALGINYPGIKCLDQGNHSQPVCYLHGSRQAPYPLQTYLEIACHSALASLSDGTWCCCTAMRIAVQGAGVYA